MIKDSSDTMEFCTLCGVNVTAELDSKVSKRIQMSFNQEKNSVEISWNCRFKAEK